ncbi:hypothetical protein Tco_0026927 [Tanacetum coccineum]
MEIQLWKFNSAHEFKDDSLSMNMKFTSLEGTMSGLIVCGLEFRPVLEVKVDRLPSHIPDSSMTESDNLRKSEGLQIVMYAWKDYILCPVWVGILSTLEDAPSESIPYSGEKKIWFGVSPVEGSPCERYWNFSTQVGTFRYHPTLCSRCYDVIAGQPSHFL